MYSAVIMCGGTISSARPDRNSTGLRARRASARGRGGFTVAVMVNAALMRAPARGPMKRAHTRAAPHTNTKAYMLVWTHMGARTGTQIRTEKERHGQ